MKWIKALMAGALLGLALIAFRDSTDDRLIADGSDEDEEPVLGYDGMDQETLLDWLGDARLDRETLLQLRRYEEGNLGREAVIEMVEELLA